MKTLSQSRAFGGTQAVVSHISECCQCDMTFGLFLPEAAELGPVPVLWYLSGLTCTHENAMVKAGAQQWAAKAGLALVFPDTSPRGTDVADDADYDLGQGAGFYVDALDLPWAAHYRMWTYVTEELPGLVFGEFPLDASRQSITGHSMGGHGALTMALRNPARYRSVSAFAPICHPTNSLWGRKQFTEYLGVEESAWAKYDATLLMRNKGLDLPLLIDQGSDDRFLELLQPQALQGAMVEKGVGGRIRMQEGYDHSYFFVATFMADHVAFHAAALRG